MQDNIALTEQEASAWASLRGYVRDNQQSLSLIWHQGDGCGGAIYEAIRSAVVGEAKLSALPAAYKKKKIPSMVRRHVFERDKYRCVECGGHIDLSLDHIIPEKLGGDSSIDNLQTMCLPCNSRKGISYE